jgi:hypothetical protein
MNKKCLFLYLLVCLLVVGCVTLKEPDSENQTLVVGMMNFQGKGFGYGGQATVNGTTKMGIEISLQELTSKKIYTMVSQIDGLFYSAKIPQGIYGIIRIYLKIEDSSGWAYLEQPYDNTAYRIEIVNGKVNNLGLFNYSVEKGRSSSLNINQGYEQVRTLFRQKNGSSNWNQKEWINNGINRANSVGYTPPVVQSSPTTSVTGVILNKTTTSLNVGDTETLTATITPYNATNQNVTWTSSDTNVARVSAGTVTGVAPGTATITVSSVDGNRIATCIVTVNGAPTSPAASVAQSSQSTQTPAPVAQTTPPPILAGYFVAVNGQQTGPYDASGLRQLIDRGQLTRDSLVWKEGMLNWVAAGTVAELAPLFASIPPPLPTNQQPPPVPDQSQTDEYRWYNSYAPGLRDNKAFLNAGIGLGPTRGLSMGLPPITASVDFKISNTVPITVGGLLTFATWKYSGGNPPYTIDLTYLNVGIGGRGMYHFNFAANLDVYAGLVLGYVIQRATISYGSGYNSGNAPNYKGVPFFLFGVNSGVRYFFTDSIGVYGELGYSGLQYLSAGLSMKF